MSGSRSSEGDAGEARLSHVDERGSARMVDISGKAVTERRAIAEAVVSMQVETRGRIEEGTVAKGGVLEVARIAGILGAKRTAELIPLCHPLPISDVRVDFEWIDAEDDTGALLRIAAAVKVSARTGVEMEALTAVSIAALTVYDMVKSLDRRVTIGGIRLLEKSGGKSGDWRRRS